MTAPKFPDRITVTASEERFSPVNYHTFAIGGFTYTTSVREDETAEQAFNRAWSFLQRMKKEKFKEVRDDFYERLLASRPNASDQSKFNAE